MKISGKLERPLIDIQKFFHNQNRLSVRDISSKKR